MGILWHVIFQERTKGKDLIILIDPITKVVNLKLFVNHSRLGKPQEGLEKGIILTWTSQAATY